jgi:TPR repeat protein
LLGDGVGCRQLGTLHAGGIGGSPPNPKLAVMFAEKACELGDAAACGNAGMNHQVGFGVPRDSARAVVFYDKACKLGETRFCDLLDRFARDAKAKEAAAK